MELPNRDELEQDFAKKFGRVARRHMHEFREYLGDPPRLENVPEEFWLQMEKESEDSVYPLLLWIFGESAALHGWVGPDASLAAFGWAKERAQEFAEYWRDSTRQRVADGFEKLRNQRKTPVDETVSDAWENARLKPYQPDEEIELTRDEISDLLEKTFGPKRIEGVAVDETTAARHSGGEAGVEATVGLADDDKWRCDWKRDKVCEICAPLDLTPRSVWEAQFPEGPPTPHHRCRCWIEYAAVPKA